MNKDEAHQFVEDTKRAVRAVNPTASDDQVLRQTCKLLKLNYEGKSWTDEDYVIRGMTDKQRIGILVAALKEQRLLWEVCGLPTRATNVSIEAIDKALKEVEDD